jgi:hypothetical protein
MALLATAVTLNAPAPPAHVLVYADEFGFNLSRAVVPAGQVILQLKNIGEDDHDLRIVGPNGTPRAATGTVRPGGLAQFRVRLPQGRYTYACTVADHADRGMAGTLVVSAPKKRRGRR